MNQRVFLLLVVVTLIASGAYADSWNPWRDQLVVSPGGKHYVVMKRTGGPKVFGQWGPVKYTICECATDSPPVKIARSKIVELGIDEYDHERGGQRYEIKANPNVNVRDGDRILGRGNLERPPLHILVSDTGLGFAGLDVYGYNYASLKADNAVVIVSSNGKVIHRKRVTDLFTTDKIADFDTSAGGMFWLNYRNPGWINDAQKRLAVVGAASEAKPNRHIIRYIDWQTGEITNGRTQDSQKAIKKLRHDDLERNL